MSYVDDEMPEGGPTAPAKADMESVAYRSAGDDGKSCAGCGSFMAPDQCQLVNGTISAGGVCDLFSPKQDESALMEQLFGGPNEQPI